MEIITSFINDFGFPVAVSVFLLFRLENKLDKLNESISDLINVISENRKETGDWYGWYDFQK